VGRYVLNVSGKRQPRPQFPSGGAILCISGFPTLQLLLHNLRRTLHHLLALFVVLLLANPLSESARPHSRVEKGQPDHHIRETAGTLAPELLAEVAEAVVVERCEADPSIEEVVALLWNPVVRLDVSEEHEDEVLVNHANRVVALWVEFAVDEAVLDPGVEKGEVELPSRDEGRNEVLAQGGAGLAVETPGFGLAEDFEAVLEFVDRAGDAGVFLGGGEEVEGSLLEKLVFGRR
jgi:hypothetical protein